MSVRVMTCTSPLRQTQPENASDYQRSGVHPRHGRPNTYMYYAG
jgi:hypothetical protein